MKRAFAILALSAALIASTADYLLGLTDETRRLG